MTREDSKSEAMGKATAAVAASAQQWDVEEGKNVTSSIYLNYLGLHAVIIILPTLMIVCRSSSLLLSRWRRNRR
jgi:hypothetical protein